MLRTGGDHGVRRHRSVRHSAARALHQLPALYVAVLAWAVTTVADDVIPIGLIARLMLAYLGRRSALAAARGRLRIEQ
jgi:hypothetical protein